MKIWVSGTIAYDIILDFPGRFAEQIDPKKIHVINLSFPVEEVKRTVGGTAANIAYNLSLLGMKVGIVGAVGEDGREIKQHYQSMGIDIKYLQVSKRYQTAASYIMTDRDDNQINAFYGGAMHERVKLPAVEGCDWSVVAAENAENMSRLASRYQKKRKRYIFDPGQAIFVLRPAQLANCLKGASIVVGNDYEIGVLMKKTGRKTFKAVVYKTLGPKGSEAIFPNNTKKKIGAVKAKKAVDPTGAGDAYRAGIIKGIAEGLDLVRAGQLGATAAVFAVEKYGTQNHWFNYDIIVKRHNKNFASKI